MRRHWDPVYDDEGALLYATRSTQAPDGSTLRAFIGSPLSRQRWVVWIDQHSPAHTVQMIGLADDIDGTRAAQLHAERRLARILRDMRAQVGAAAEFAAEVR